MLVPIAEIRTGRRRALREKTVAQLMDSIGKIGLLTPISVDTGVSEANGVSFMLVTGGHRLEAARRLGWAEIEATVVQMTAGQRELWEIDENLCRAELTELERGEHLARRKAIYETEWPQTKAGGDRRSEGFQNDKLSFRSFADDTAAKVGMDKRSVQRAIHRVSEIDPKVRDRVRDMPLIADSGVELDALAALEPAEQRRVVKMVEDGRVATVRDAVKTIAPTIEQSIDEKWKRRFVSLLDEATDELRRWAREYLAEGK